MIDYKVFKNSKVLVTGATGLIGQAVIHMLLQNGAKVIALVRNKEKAELIFSKFKNFPLTFLVSDVCEISIENIGIDYIIHGASQTSSKAFIEDPVETIVIALKGTFNLLELAKINPIKSFIYLSSMEVYGSPKTNSKILENHSSNLDTMNVRSSYPESKRMCENLCAAYVKKYNVPAKVIRLTQTFGPGVQYNDGRVFAEFARCAIEGKNIILNTTGETKRCYLYIDDAVSAILTVLYMGKTGEAYNAANEFTYCSIYEMAHIVASIDDQNKVDVIVKNNPNIEQYGYAPTLKMNLGTQKLQKLGWKPTVGLEEMFRKLIEDMRKQKYKGE